MTQTHAQLREQFTKQHEKWLIGTDDDAEMAQEWVMENLPSLLALLFPPDPGLASLVGEIDAAYEKATSGPWAYESLGEKGDGANVIGVYFGPDDIDCKEQLAGRIDSNELYTVDQETGEESWPEYYRDEETAVCEHQTRNAGANAALIVALVNNWPRIRAALTTGGWRDGRKSTGMHDEEGREILEGDWVKFNVSFFDGNFKNEPISGKIVYVPELMSFQLVNVQSDYWREYTGGDDSTYQPFSELNFTEADFTVINPPSKPDAGE